MKNNLNNILAICHSKSVRFLSVPFLFFVFLVSPSMSYSQLFKEIKPIRTESNIAYYALDKDTIKCPINGANKANEQCLLYCQKAKEGYLFCEKHDEISLGCDVYRVTKDGMQKLQFFPYVAYTRDEGGRMNYNNIIPYISIVKSENRVILSFKCNLVVENPNTTSEKIENTKGMYGQILDNQIEIKRY